MINYTPVSPNPYQPTTIDETKNSGKLLLTKIINKVVNVSEQISSNKKWIAGAVLTGVGIIGMMALALSSRFAPNSTGVDGAHGTTENAEKSLINNAINHTPSLNNPTWEQLDNITGIEITVVTSKKETFSDNLIIEPNRIFAVAASFRDSVKTLLFTNYMKLISTASAGGINRYFYHSLKITISKGEKIATHFNRLVIKNARSREFSPQNIDAMKKIVDRLADEIQHLNEYKQNMADRMNKRIEFTQDTANEWHAYFQASFEKINEMINSLLKFKH